MPENFRRREDIPAQSYNSAKFTGSDLPALARTLDGKPSMSDATVKARIVLTTTASPEEAASIGRALVEEHLIACASMIPGVQSIYRWLGQIESAMETMLILKTSLEQLPALESRLKELHSYDTPEFLVLSVESGSHPYLEWLQTSLKGR
jgi:periplasmic divalent cation tolerance protein